MDDPRPGTAGSGPGPRPPRDRSTQNAPRNPGGPAEMGIALDVLRVAASLAVVFYHAALAYLVHPLRLTLWFYDSNTHPSMDFVACWVNAFAMPLFFLAAGISAPAAVESRGVRVFLEHRVKRLLRPLLFGVVFLIPVAYLIVGYGLLATGRIDLENILSWRFPASVDRHLYGLGHLWFLEYLFLVCVVWALGWQVARWVRHRWGLTEAGEGRASWSVRIIESAGRPFWLAVPTFLVFLVDPDTLLRIENTLIPDLARMIHYTVFFAAGAWLARVKEPKARLAPFSTIYVVLAVVDFVVMWPLLSAHFAAPLGGTEGRLLAGLAALFPWLAIFGSLGVLLRTVHTRSTTLRYLSEASFWLYIVHLPVVQLSQVVLLHFDLAAPVKFLIASTVALAVSLVSYEWVVRYSLVGEIVNGTRKRAPKRGRLRVEMGWIASLAGVLLGFLTLVWYHRTHIWEHNFHEVVAGRLYRSARMKPEALEQTIERHRIRTVITLGGGDHHRWYLRQSVLCRTLGVEFTPLNLRGDRPPPREVLRQLIELHDTASAPVLVQGFRGIDPCGFAAAVCQLLDGVSPERALDQFSASYGQYSGPERSILGIVLITYRDWLVAQGWSHTPERFRAWATDAYLVSSNPAVPPEVAERVSAITTAADRAAVRR